MKNYRPISLLLVQAKILEKHLNQTLIGYAEKQGFISVFLELLCVEGMCVRVEGVEGSGERQDGCGEEMEVGMLSLYMNLT
ncbi:hypothetical protein NDU88_003263 [Pleurodeles waltl]|uniref:Uncharacterized protein n=1 Tax=Pleurodeles waltl TaxID=8319 RepID=A0AAV7QCA2_PLEWA|nr:hypothetical protein NDU88_003263 [Pleurodeles waltl]